MISVVQSVAERAKADPAHIAVIAEDIQITYAELWREIRGFTAYIQSLGLEKGSRILVKSASSIWYPICVLAIHLSGNVAVPLEKTIAAEGLLAIADELSPAMVIADLELDTVLPTVHPQDIRGLAHENFSENADFAFPTPDQLCDILFTTGTTGKSKGVVLSHRAVFAAADNIVFGNMLTEKSVYMLPVPLNHANGIRKMYATLVAGATVVLLDGFSNLRKFYAGIKEYGVTGILLPPASVRMLLVLSAKELAKYADQIEFIHTSAAAFPESDKERMIELLPNTRLSFGYGSSEAASTTMFDYAKYPGKLSCIGKQNKHSKVYIVDDDRNVIESSKEHTGLIAIGGDVVMQGYYNAPELTAEVLQDGIVYTNDIGYIDEEGFVYMLGRRGDVINVGGLKIAPTEVEDVVLRFPGIAECACFPVEDKLTGVAPKLHIVPEKGVEIDLKALRAHMAKHLEAYKIAKIIETVDEIPKTANGKINRKVLK